MGDGPHCCGMKPLQIGPLFRVYDVDFCQCVKWGIAFEAYCGLRVMIDLPLQSGLQVFPDRRPCGAAKFNRF